MRRNKLKFESITYSSAMFVTLDEVLIKAATTAVLVILSNVSGAVTGHSAEYVSYVDGLILKYII